MKQLFFIPAEFHLLCSIFCDTSLNAIFLYMGTPKIVKSFHSFWNNRIFDANKKMF